MAQPSFFRRSAAGFIPEGSGAEEIRRECNSFRQLLNSEGFTFDLKFRRLSFLLCPHNTTSKSSKQYNIQQTEGNIHTKKVGGHGT